MDLDTLTAAVILLIVIAYLVVRIIAFVTAARRTQPDTEED
jgi:hypothetical protein